LPGRAHHVISHPKLAVVAVVSRRPGYFLTIFNRHTAEVTHTINAENDYHFFGHGVYSSDGRYLITAENRISTGLGVIVIRDALTDYRVVSRFPSNGIGPHQIKLNLNEDVIIVANGGILTHPDRGREKLNLDTMSPSLDYIDVSSGKVLESHKLSADLHQLSIRHIDINQQEKVVLVMQYQGDKYDDVPLVGVHRRGESIKLLRAPNDINLKMKQYCGSVCFDAGGEYFAVSSPKGDLITFWRAEDNKFVSASRCRDACGIASSGVAEFIVSNGLGELYRYAISRKLHVFEKQKIVLESDHQLAFDNHLSLV